MSSTLHLGCQQYFTDSKLWRGKAIVASPWHFYELIGMCTPVSGITLQYMSSGSKMAESRVDRVDLLDFPLDIGTGQQQMAFKFCLLSF